MTLSGLLTGILLSACGGVVPVSELPPPVTPDPMKLECSELGAEACEAESDCFPSYSYATQCDNQGCEQVELFDACLDQPINKPICPEVTCGLYCPFGFTKNANNCEICVCALANIPCSEMNEEQCNIVPECYAIYTDSDGPSGDRAPGRRPPPTERKFLECRERNQNLCESHFDCPGGYCEYADNPSGPNVPGANQCITPPCTDGSTINCRSPKPNCGSGLVPSVKDSCWTCVDPNLCGGRPCEDPGPGTRYLSSDPDDCELRQLEACGEGEQAFTNECGCGCYQADEPTQCPPGSRDLVYVGRSAQECATLSYFCPPEFSDFYNECGCGCYREGTMPPSKS